MPIERVAAFVRGESSEGFDQLALAVFRHQYERIDAFRDLCDRRGAAPGAVSDWRQVPAVGLSELGDAAPQADLAGRPELRELFRTVTDRTFGAHCLAGLDRPPVLSLVPAGPAGGDPALDLLVDHLLSRRAAASSRIAAAPRGVEVAKARSFLAARQRDRRPTLLLGAPAPLEQLLAALVRRGLRFRLPPGSRVVQLSAGRTAGAGLLDRIAETLAVPAESVVREYAVSGLGTRFYAAHDLRGDLRRFHPPPWVRVRALDPNTLAPLPAGVPGALAVYDLAGLASVAHLLSGDTGDVAEEAFRVDRGAAATCRAESD